MPVLPNLTICNCLKSPEKDLRVDVAGQLILAWVMMADEHIGSGEQERLNAYRLKYLRHTRLTDELLIESLQDSDGGYIREALLILKNDLSTYQQHVFFELAIGMVLADGRISLQEKHVLDLLADVFTISDKVKKSTYHKISGKRWLNDVDLSSKRWWVKKEATLTDRKGRPSNRVYNRDRCSSEEQFVRMVKALAILSLTEGATEKQVEKMYRKMALLHHPDKFQTLSPEMIRAANITFCQINEAYEYLQTLW